MNTINIVKKKLIETVTASMLAQAQSKDGLEPNLIKEKVEKAIDKLLGYPKSNEK